MRRSLLSTSSLSILNITIISVTLLTQNIANAESVEHRYTPSIELSTRGGNKRTISELDYMQPLWEAGNNLGLLDIKLKADNKKSKEINVGLSYRHNLNDQVILGIYSFFDRRTTGNNFSVNGLTAGVEAITKYVDLRANYYLPQDKKKKIEHNNKKQVKIQGTSIYAVTGGHTYEYSFKGFDMEIGASLLGFSDNLNEKFGTKVFVAYYDFRNKNTKSITGTRIRLEQKLGKISFGDNAMQFTLNAETQSDKVRKRQSSVGIGAKFIFKDKVRHKEGLRGRMLDMIVRDVDIVTESEKAADKVSNFVGDDGREINKLYFVAKVAPSSGYEGDGTAEKPYSTEQLKRLKLDDALVVVTKVDSSKGGANMTKQEYEELKALPQVVNGKKELNLVSKSSGEGEEKVSIAIKGEKGIKIVAEDAVNTTIEADIIPAIASSSTQQVKSQITSSVAVAGGAIATAVAEVELISEPVVAELLTEVQEETIPVAPPLPEERVRENNNTNQQSTRTQRESARRQRAQEEAQRQEAERRAAIEREERIARERAAQEEADRRLALQLAQQEEEDRRLAEQMVQQEEAEQRARAEREAEERARVEREEAQRQENERRLAQERERAEGERLERERVEGEARARAEREEAERRAAEVNREEEPNRNEEAQPVVQQNNDEVAQDGAEPQPIVEQNNAPQAQEPNNVPEVALVNNGAEAQPVVEQNNAQQDQALDENQVAANPFDAQVNEATLRADVERRLTEEQLRVQAIKNELARLLGEEEREVFRPVRIQAITRINNLGQQEVILPEKMLNITNIATATRKLEKAEKELRDIEYKKGRIARITNQNGDYVPYDPNNVAHRWRRVITRDGQPASAEEIRRREMEEINRWNNDTIIREAKKTYYNNVKTEIKPMVDKFESINAKRMIKLQRKIDMGMEDDLTIQDTQFMENYRRTLTERQAQINNPIISQLQRDQLQRTLQKQKRIEQLALEKLTVKNKPLSNEFITRRDELRLEFNNPGENQYNPNRNLVNREEIDRHINNKVEFLLLARQAANLAPGNADWSDQAYVRKDTLFKTALEVYRANPNLQLNQINQLVETRFPNAQPRDKDEYKRILRNLAKEFESIATNSMAMTNNNIDVTSVYSIQSLNEQYGAISGRKALELAKNIVINRINATHNLNGRDVQEVATVSRDFNDHYLNSYRAMIKIEGTNNQLPHNYTETIYERYDTKEALGYVIKAMLDVNEIRNELVLEQRDITPLNIFNKQIERIDTMIYLGLSDSIRAYNIDYDDPLSIDRPSCPHGFFNRIMASTSGQHRNVYLEKNAPETLKQRIIPVFKEKVENLPQAQKNEIVAAHNQIKTHINGLTQTQKEAFMTNLRVNRDNNNVYSIVLPPVVQGINIPASYNNALNEAIREIDSKLRFIPGRHRIRLIGDPLALNAIKNVVNTRLNNN